ncbi:hypothetical protein QE152_g1202 [Popillia japonica]|uniref:Uncharacterized protein n=1 Tax=Popillia japonica TaxID=7064 RepID=A0AAW1NA34_POPJA
MLQLSQFNTVLNSQKKLLDLVLTNLNCNIINERDQHPLVPEDTYHTALSFVISLTCQGFKYDKNADEYKNKSAFVKQSFSVAELVAVCNLLHLDYEGSLEELAEKIMGALINVDSLQKENKEDYDEEDEYDDSEMMITMNKKTW